MHDPRDATRAEMLKWRVRMREESEKFTPRYQRARHHAHAMLAVVVNFVPDACREGAFEELMLTFFASDFEIVTVPPTRDAERAATLADAMVNIKPQIITS